MELTDSMRQPVGVNITKSPEGTTFTSGVYGLELLLDCHECDVSKFTVKSLKAYFRNLIKLIKMEAGEEPHFYEEETGLNAVQFIITSQIAIHCVDKIERVYVDIFSCKDFDMGDAKHFTQEWFGALSVREHLVHRC